MGSTTSMQMNSSTFTTSNGNRMTAEEMQLKQIEQMPLYKRPETFDEKLWRKVRLIRKFVT
jgi:hypothetical protein